MENTNKKYGKESKLKLSRHADENNNDDIASVGETHYFDILNGISCVSFQKEKENMLNIVFFRNSTGTHLAFLCLIIFMKMLLM